jgi:hypothetical protein
MIETITNNPWLAGSVVLVTQIIFLYFRTLNVMYTAEHKILPSIITGNAIGLAWLITIAVGVNAMMEGQWQPILAHIIGGTVGTIWGFISKERLDRKKGIIIDVRLEKDYLTKGNIVIVGNNTQARVLRAPSDQGWWRKKSRRELYTVKIER